MAKKKTKKSKKKSQYKHQKVLMHRLDGPWEEWASWHLGPIHTVPPEEHVGWKVLEDREVTQAPYTETYDRWVKLEWTGAHELYDLF